MSESRTVDQIILGSGQPVDDVVDWLHRHGITRCALVMSPYDPALPHGLVYQESYLAPVQLALPGDELRAVDLGGTSGALTVIHGGRPLLDEEPS